MPEILASTISMKLHNENGSTEYFVVNQSLANKRTMPKRMQCI